MFSDCRQRETENPLARKRDEVKDFPGLPLGVRRLPYPRFGEGAPRAPGSVRDLKTKMKPTLAALLAFGQPRQAELVEHLLVQGFDEDKMKQILKKLMIALSPINYKTQDVTKRGAESRLADRRASSFRPIWSRRTRNPLLRYWFHTKGAVTPHLSILTPEKPGSSTIELLGWLEVGVLWVEGGTIKTFSKRLAALCAN